MSKHRDYKTADAPKAEPLKATLGEKLRIALGGSTASGSTKASDLAALLDAALKEQTP